MCTYQLYLLHSVPAQQQARPVEALQLDCQLISLLVHYLGLLWLELQFLFNIE